MAKGFGGLVDTLAYGTLNEFLGMGRSRDGISRPNRYEVTIVSTIWIQRFWWLTK